MGPKLCKTLEIRRECMRVCVCMCATALLKAKMFKAFAIYFLVYLGYGLNSREKVIFCPNYFVSVLL